MVAFKDWLVLVQKVFGVDDLTIKGDPDLKDEIITLYARAREDLNEENLEKKIIVEIKEVLEKYDSS